MPTQNTIDPTLVASGIDKLDTTEQRNNGFYAEREDESHLLSLGVVSGHNVFFISDPGTGKDALIRSFVEAFEFFTSDPERYFWSLIGPTLTPDEVFGGFDIKEFEQGNFKRNVDGFAPTAYIANFIELFKGNDVINNTFLTYLNEHRIKNGKDEIEVPLLFALASSNEMPDDNQGALVDRFAIKKAVQPVRDKANLMRIWKNRSLGITSPDMSDIGITVDEVYAMRAAAVEVDVSDAMWEVFFLILDELRKEELEVSVRKQNLAIDIIKVEALLNGRSSVESEDFAILQHVLWNDVDDSQKVRQIILRVANPMMDEIHTGIDASKRALDKARKGIANGATEDDKIRIGSDARTEIESVLKALRQMVRTVNEDTKTGKELKRAIGRVTRYQKSLMSDVFGLDVDALTKIAEGE
jgi:MoxR-like ATPase